jgi:hypothetical protein
MNLTISELARAVGKSEGFVRQHIHRGHLPVRRAGGRVSVALDEALNWARARELPLVQPRSTRSEGTCAVDRVARITVLAWEPKGELAKNLFTLVRLRTRHTLGPWAPETNGEWFCAEAEGDLRLFSVDCPADRAREAIGQIVNAGELSVGEIDVHYALVPTPRHHGAYRDNRRGEETGIPSPFTNHSAAITEYWSRADELGDRWYALLGAPPPGVAPLLARLGFALDRYPDRVGNVVVADAQDALSCSLSATWDNTLRFSVRSVGPLRDYLRATIWARHCRDEILRVQAPVTLGTRVIPVPTDMDEIGFSVYDTSDGRCVDMMAYYLLTEIVVNLGVTTGPTLHLRDRGPRGIRHSHASTSRSQIRVDPRENEKGLDASVRQRYLRRTSYLREATARNGQRLASFGPDDFPQATDYFIGLLPSYADSRKPIYIADPYFMKDVGRPELMRFYLKVFSATSNRTLNILCKGDGETRNPPWWASLPATMIRHVRVRSFSVPKRPNLGYFHDRYVITPDREVSVSTSFNGWKRTGVVLIEVPFGVYRTQAERLWALPPGYENKTVRVGEIYDGRPNG